MNQYDESYPVVLAEFVSLCGLWTVWLNRRLAIVEVGILPILCVVHEK